MADHGENYSIFQSGILDKLENPRWFADCISENCRDIAQKYCCHIEVSGARALYAQDYYLRDLERNLQFNMPDGSLSLDHFKHAAFLCFWMRRMLPIISVYKLPIKTGTDSLPGMSSIDQSHRQHQFFEFGNEICAMELGRQLCLYYETVVAGQNAEARGVTFKVAKYILERAPKPPTERFFNEMLSTLKGKSNSPYTLYLLYVALFRPAGFVPANTA